MQRAALKSVWRLLPAPVRHKFWSAYYRYFYIHKPVNFKRRNSGNIDADVESARDYATLIHAMLDGWGFDLSRTSLLEVGPGINFGAQLLLAQHGTRITVADRFLSAWDATYHPVFYRHLRDQAGKKGGPLDDIVAANEYPPEVISLVKAPAETLSGIPDASLDVVLSNAVLEHVSDLEAACRSFARVTKPGGMNSHQVDFRDHDNFDRPLEFLLQRKSTSKIEFMCRRGERGN